MKLLNTIMRYVNMMKKYIECKATNNTLNAKYLLFNVLSFF